MLDVLVFLVLMLIIDRWQQREAQIALADWAAQNGFEIVSRRRSFWSGPSWWRMGPNAVVLQVVVRVSNGRTRAGHAYCRPFVLFGKPVREIWED